MVKSCIGLNIPGTSREVSFCQHMMVKNCTMIIPDATRDATFAENPLVAGEPGIRFYAALR